LGPEIPSDVFLLIRQKRVASFLPQLIVQLIYFISRQNTGSKSVKFFVFRMTAQKAET